MGPAYSITKTVSHDIWGPAGSQYLSINAFWYHTTPLESSEQCYQSIIHTKIFYKNLLRIQDILILPNKRLVIFQDLLLGVENAQTVWVHATRLLRQCNLDILHSRPIRYVHCRWKIFDRLPRSCRSRLAVAVQWFAE